MTDKKPLRPPSLEVRRIANALNNVEAAIVIQSRAVDTLRPLNLPPEILQMQEAAVAGLCCSAENLHTALARMAKKYSLDPESMATQFGPGTGK